MGGSWTLFLELVWYIAISVLALIYLNKRPNVLVCLSLLISVLAQIACAFGHHVPMGHLSMLICCVFGLVCYRREQGDISDRNFFVLFGLLIFIIALNLFVGFKLFPSANPSVSFHTAIEFLGTSCRHFLRTLLHATNSTLGPFDLELSRPHKLFGVFVTRDHSDAIN